MSVAGQGDVLRRGLHGAAAVQGGRNRVRQHELAGLGMDYTREDAGCDQQHRGGGVRTLYHIVFHAFRARLRS